MNKYLFSSKDVNKEYLEYFINSRGLNNAQMAKSLEVERATVGAWLAGKREISEKYKEKIYEFSKLSLTDDLIIMPTVKKLLKCIENVDEPSDTSYITKAYTSITNHVAYKLLDFIPHKMSEIELDAIANLLNASDVTSLTALNDVISQAINHRLYIYSISPHEYAEECIKSVELNQQKINRLRSLPQYSSIAHETFNEDILFELCDDFLYVHFALSFSIDDELSKRSNQIDDDFAQWNEEFHCYEGVFDDETGKCTLDDDELQRALIPIKEEHIESVCSRADSIFGFTEFIPETTNDQWIENNSYSVTYKISLNDPKFKESLRIVMCRLGIKVETCDD
ncbi:TPA: hypothetical protein ACHHZH_000707 [Legionella pneumophila]